MQKQSFLWHFLKSIAVINVKNKIKLMKQIILCTMLSLGYATGNLLAQGNVITRTPEEERELFGYCEKPELIKKIKISSEMADKVGEIDYWARVQQINIEANTNDAFATRGELEQEVIKKYKAIRLTDEQLKSLIDFKRERLSNPGACAVITLSLHHTFDTLSVQRALLLYKNKNRKPLIDKIGINGRQADMLFEIEVWKQKESLSIAGIPIADFNRIRKTVSMYSEREKRYRAVGLTDEQIDAVIQFFDQHQL